MILHQHRMQLFFPIAHSNGDKSINEMRFVFVSCAKRIEQKNETDKNDCTRDECAAPHFDHMYPWSAWNRFDASTVAASSRDFVVLATYCTLVSRASIVTCTADNRFRDYFFRRFCGWIWSARSQFPLHTSKLLTKQKKGPMKKVERATDSIKNKNERGKSWECVAVKVFRVGEMCVWKVFSFLFSMAESICRRARRAQQNYK